MTRFKQVEYILQTIPETRNSDIALTIEIWKHYYPQRVQDGKVALEDLYDLPREDIVKRQRALIQNHPTNPRFLPTSLAVVKQRKINEEVWREYCRKTNTSPTGTEQEMRQVIKI